MLFIHPVSRGQGIGQRLLEYAVKVLGATKVDVNEPNVFYAQLVYQGKAFQKPKNKLGKGDVGLDLGPSTIARN